MVLATRNQTAHTMPALYSYIDVTLGKRQINSSSHGRIWVTNESNVTYRKHYMPCALELCGLRFVPSMKTTWPTL